MEQATSGRAAALLFPRIDPSAVPALADGARTIADDDFMTGATEDRYPDHFDLARGIKGGGNDLACASAASEPRRLHSIRSCRGSFAYTHACAWTCARTTRR